MAEKRCFQARWANYFAEMPLDGPRRANFFAEMPLEALCWATFVAVVLVVIAVSCPVRAVSLTQLHAPGIVGLGQWIMGRRVARRRRPYNAHPQIRHERTGMPRPASAVVTSKPARFVLALLRIAVGFIFLWSFLDKTFGLHYSTGPSRAWINGGTPAQSYLTGATTGKPLASFFESLAVPAMDWLFMLGLLGIGLAFLLGIGTRLAALAGVVMLGFMYAAVAPWVWGSLNPVVNEHLVYALVLILIPLTSAGDTLGLGAWWKGLGLVKKLPFLI